MSNTEKTSNEPSNSSKKYHLMVEFEIVSVESLRCPIEEFDNQVDNVIQQSTGADCHTDTTVTTSDEGSPTETEIVHKQSTVEESCHCPVFAEFNCIPEIIDVTDEYVIVRTFLADRSQLTDLIEALKTTVERLSLRRLLRVNATDKTDVYTLNLSSLTETERETAINAVESGYYEQPRETSLGELAEELGISESATSQRLTAIESKLALATFPGEK